MNQKYPKSEKLKSRKAMKRLFAEGQNLFMYPYHIYYIEDITSDSWVKFGVSVRKKDYKKAVDRNVLKRRMRECFRLNKEELKSSLNEIPHSIMLVYVGKEIMNFPEMQRHYLSLIARLKADGS